MRNRLDRWWEKPERGPLKRGYRHRALLVDIYAPDYIRMWLAFDGDEVVSVCEDSVGLEAPPEWFDRDVIETGWDTVLGVWDWWLEGWSRELHWMMRHGIAPGQPFLIHMDTPHWHKTSYEYEEWDCEFDWYILRVAPLRRPSNALAIWERTIKAEKSARAAAKRRHAEVTCLRRTDVKEMYLRGDVYFAPGQSSYDDMEMPRGWRYTLCTNAVPPGASLVSGEDHDGNHEKAMAALVANAMKELPGLAEETIRKLPHRRW